MKGLIIGIFTIFFIVKNSFAILYGPNKINRTLHGNGNAGEALFLTPYLKTDNIEKGRQAATVSPLKGNMTSYAGYFTVNEKFNSNIYMWYFPAEQNAKTAPVLVWLQGGPGASSMGGLFEELGPYYVSPSANKLKKRKIYWSQQFNVIFIDNPVGTGFSFTDSDDGYSTNQAQVGSNLYEMIQQFYQLFPELVENDFYITGESYAGKYVPAFAYTIHKQNLIKDKKINLKGLSIGNGLVDPETQLHYSDYLSKIGLIDLKTKEIFKQKEAELKNFINNKNWVMAWEKFDELLNGDLTPYTTLFYNVTGFDVYFNFLKTNNKRRPFGDYSKFLNKEEIRRAIHVGNQPFHQDTKVEIKLKYDVPQSIIEWLQVLLDNYKVMLYNGQLDIIVPFTLTEQYINKLQWCGSKDYKLANRKIWKINDDIAGYAKVIKPTSCQGSLTEALVRDAGHMVPTDQPLWALDLISRFVYNKNF